MFLHHANEAKGTAVKAAILEAPATELIVEDIEYQEPLTGEVLVRIAASRNCIAAHDCSWYFLRLHRWMTIGSAAAMPQASIAGLANCRKAKRGAIYRTLRWRVARMALSAPSSG